MFLINDYQTNWYLIGAKFVVKSNREFEENASQDDQVINSTNEVNYIHIFKKSKLIYD